MAGSSGLNLWLRMDTQPASSAPAVTGTGSLRVSGADLGASRVRDHTQPPAHMSSPGVRHARRSPGPEPLHLPPHQAPAPACARGWGAGQRCLVDLGRPVLSSILSGTAAAPCRPCWGAAREAWFSTLLPPTSKSRLSSTLSTSETLLEPSRALRLSRLQAQECGAPPACPLGCSLCRADHTPDHTGACPTQLTPAHTRDTGGAGEGPKGPAPGH